MAVRPTLKPIIDTTPIKPIPVDNKPSSEIKQIKANNAKSQNLFAE